MRIIGKGYIGSTLNLPDVQGTVLLAGYSSVAMCENDPRGAWVSNVDYFREILNSVGDELFIYASSGTVYDGLDNPNEETKQFNLTNTYNLTKHTIDNLAQLYGKNYYGLRFATVCGWSPNLRVDVMINKMVHDARTTGKVTVGSPHLKRPILGIRDLQRAILHIIETRPEPGLYNLASFTHSVSEMAQIVASRYEAEVVSVPDKTPPYSYGLDTSKIEDTGFKFYDTLDSILLDLEQPPERIKVCV